MKLFGEMRKLRRRLLCFLGFHKPIWKGYYGEIIRIECIFCKKGKRKDGKY